MRLELIFPGKTKESYLKKGIADFTERLSHYVKTDFKVIKDRSGGKDTARAIQLEGEQLLESCSKSAYVVALDPGGRQLSSEEFAKTVDNWEGQGRQVVSFVIGGPEGLSAAVLARSDLLLSLSRMTFTHEMARLLLLEQLYRAYSIKAGTKYHK
ncbi:MAG: 23S rRNA (pseudouridine(1915)-N(3))-methyltransferase RlmH [Proteobacteria bacterium]|nr:23S rRNA (pseudouridine(1915)-N(3))-methyltransferase RlmH [Pseudomonadota bacterium]MBU4298253.1 23S rRNA (pseudouridine(1915)-N(3))-methyltransferase RlmH [Pseudomonadota bacterium]MCG2747521.1 23S rRNA (pseudouridine(1915)-N(3))-methyltransferase RlmH [Desulfobulbaceae bacterium]